jgi:DNA primase
MNRNAVETIKQKLSIESVVGSYIKLDPKGKYFTARCPFHNEKTASFSVTPDKGIFYCYGCHKGGDIFTFVQEIEGLAFPDALKQLAEKAGVSLDKNDQQQTGRISLLRSIMHDAAKYYEIGLRTHKPAVDYLLDRGVTKETMVSFHIGYASLGWSGLYEYLKKKQYHDQDILATGLCIESKNQSQGNRMYDRFRERIMFPINDYQGRVIAFTGRVLPGTQESLRPVGKYINSPETDLYHKSKVLFGYDRAKSAIHTHGFVIMVEGQMDCIMSHQSGIDHVVAISGTAATDDHMNQIKRFTEKIVLCLDADNAGMTAALKTAMVAYRHDMQVAILDLGGMKDPADVIKDSPETWKKLVERRVDIITFRLKKMIERNEMDQKKEIAHKELFPLIEHLTSAIVVDEKLQEIAHAFGSSSVEPLRKDFEQYLQKKNIQETSLTTPETFEEKKPERSLEQEIDMLEYLLGERSSSDCSQEMRQIFFSQLERTLGSFEADRAPYERLREKIKTRLHIQQLDQEKKQLDSKRHHHPDDETLLRDIFEISRRKDDLIRHYNQLP